MTIVTLQSDVAFGYVGNAIARPALQMLGHEVVSLPSIYLSCHKGYRQAVAFGAPLDVAQALEAVSQRLDWSEVTLISGFLASPEQGRDLACFLRAHKPLRYVLDPVLGDEEPGLYVPSELVQVFREDLFPLADALCLNAFEARTLFGSVENCFTLTKVEQTCLVTSVVTGNDDRLQVQARERGRRLSVSTPKLTSNLPLPNGLGDLASALLTDALVNKQHLRDQLPRIVSSLYSLLKLAIADQRRELNLPSFASELREPSLRFELD